MCLSTVAAASISRIMPQTSQDPVPHHASPVRKQEAKLQGSRFPEKSGLKQGKLGLHCFAILRASLPCSSAVPFVRMRTPKVAKNSFAKLHCFTLSIDIEATLQTIRTEPGSTWPQVLSKLGLPELSTNSSLRDPCTSSSPTQAT